MALGGAAVGVVGGTAVIAGIVLLINNVRRSQKQKQDDRDRDKEPSEEELRERAPSLPSPDNVENLRECVLSPSSPDDVEKLRKQVRFTPDVTPGVDMDTALFAFRSGDVDEIRRILAEHGAVYEIIRAPQ